MINSEHSIGETFRMASDDPITLSQFLKLMGVAGTGGQAKLMVQGGMVQVNGEVETRRGRKLKNGDLVSALDQTFQVDL
jgi:ribosome-associated protein